MDGVAVQAGVVLAGLILILADRVRQPWVVAVFGLVFAGLAVVGASAPACLPRGGDGRAPGGQP